MMTVAVSISVSVSVSVSVALRPEFGATRSGEDSRRRFGLFEPGRAWQDVEGFGNFLNDRAVDHLITRGEPIQHRVVADVVNRARNSRGAAKDVIDSAG